MDGQLMGTQGGYLSTGAGIASIPCALEATLDSISTNFTVTNGGISWNNTEFANGIAGIFRTPANLVADAKIIARFAGAIEPDWVAVALMAMPAPSLPANASQSTSMASVVGAGSSSSSATPGQYSAGRTSTSGSSYSSISTTFGTPTPVSGNTASHSTSQSATPTFACPANNGSTITDTNGVQYMLGCGEDTTTSSYTATTVTGSFDECFALCDTLIDCLSFVYVGGTNGVGSGQCEFKHQTGTFVASDGGHVAAIRISPLISSSTAATLASFSSTGPIGPSFVQRVGLEVFHDEHFLRQKLFEPVFDVFLHQHDVQFDSWSIWFPDLDIIISQYSE
ncbi:hypothetical protein LTR62_001671 [Meristemomyces frigidus]|uniref:Apple domain-containing protein n=1 Tax=Meristemomyces frigidus TaxID=1508187 RepID=A0AAN7T957_9PEZI|nr:hypothetical protein LTR62_001671 [Meristemomyces frigidus]